VEKVSGEKTSHKFHLLLFIVIASMFIKLKISVFSELSKSCVTSAASKLPYSLHS